MKVKINSTTHPVFERNTVENYKFAKSKAIAITTNSELFFKMLVDLSISEGLTCGECYGFQCSGCWRGIIVAYAIQNKTFFDWLHRNSEMTGVREILLGITQINDLDVG